MRVNIHSRCFAEILIQTVKKFQPEELAIRIRDFDQEVCTQLFLRELKPVLPNPEQVRADCSASQILGLTVLCRSES